MFLHCRAWGRMSLSSAFGAALPRRSCTYGLMKAARLGGVGNDSQFTCSICSLPCAVMLHRWQRLSCLQVRRSKYPFRSSEAITFEAFERVSPISLAISPARRLSLFASIHSSMSSLMFMPNVVSNALSNSTTARKMLCILCMQLLSIRFSCVVLLQKSFFYHSFEFGFGVRTYRHGWLAFLWYEQQRWYGTYVEQCR